MSRGDGDRESGSGPGLTFALELEHGAWGQAQPGRTLPGHRACLQKGPFFWQLPDLLSQAVRLSSPTGRTYLQQLLQRTHYSNSATPRQQARDLDRKYKWPANLERRSGLLIIKKRHKQEQHTVFASPVGNPLLNGEYYSKTRRQRAFFSRHSA